MPPPRIPLIPHDPLGSFIGSAVVDRLPPLPPFFPPTSPTGPQPPATPPPPGQYPSRPLPGQQPTRGPLAEALDALLRGNRLAQPDVPFMGIPGAPDFGKVPDLLDLQTAYGDRPIGNFPYPGQGFPGAGPPPPGYDPNIPQIPIGELGRSDIGTPRGDLADELMRDAEWGRVGENWDNFVGNIPSMPWIGRPGDWLGIPPYSGGPAPTPPPPQPQPPTYQRPIPPVFGIPPKLRPGTPRPRPGRPYPPRPPTPGMYEPGTAMDRSQPGLFPPR
jgi:hypothetical protein